MDFFRKLISTKTQYVFPKLKSSTQSNLNLNFNNNLIDENEKFKYFGLSLEEVVREEGSRVPFLITSCCQYIYENGLDHEGIFRINGNAKDVDNLREEINEKGMVSLEGTDLTTVTSLLKLFLRSLPISLVPQKLGKEFINSVSMEKISEEHFISHLKHLTNKLAKTNYLTLKYLGHLLYILSNNNKNKMDAHALGVVMGPSIFRPHFAHQVASNYLLTCLIKNFPSIFMSEEPVNSIHYLVDPNLPKLKHYLIPSFLPQYIEIGNQNQIHPKTIQNFKAKEETSLFEKVDNVEKSTSYLEKDILFSKKDSKRESLYQLIGEVVYSFLFNNEGIEQLSECKKGKDSKKKQINNKKTQSKQDFQNLKLESQQGKILQKEFDEDEDDNDNSQENIPYEDEKNKHVDNDLESFEESEIKNNEDSYKNKIKIINEKLKYSNLIDTNNIENENKKSKIILDNNFKSKNQDHKLPIVQPSTPPMSINKNLNKTQKVHKYTNSPPQSSEKKLQYSLSSSPSPCSLVSSSSIHLYSLSSTKNHLLSSFPQKISQPVHSSSTSTLSLSSTNLRYSDKVNEKKKDMRQQSLKKQEHILKNPPNRPQNKIESIKQVDQNTTKSINKLNFHLENQKLLQKIQKSSMVQPKLIPNNYLKQPHKLIYNKSNKFISDAEGSSQELSSDKQEEPKKKFDQEDINSQKIKFHHSPTILSPRPLPANQCLSQLTSINDSMINFYSQHKKTSSIAYSSSTPSVEENILNNSTKCSREEKKREIYNSTNLEMVNILKNELFPKYHETYSEEENDSFMMVGSEESGEEERIESQKPFHGRSMITISADLETTQQNKIDKEKQKIKARDHTKTSAFKKKERIKSVASLSSKSKNSPQKVIKRMRPSSAEKNLFSDEKKVSFKSSISINSSFTGISSLSPHLTSSSETQSILKEKQKDEKMKEKKDLINELNRQLQQRRQSQNRSFNIRKMSLVELRREKVDLQKLLLFYETIFGKPSSDEEKLLTRQYYNRYSNVKQTLKLFDDKIKSGKLN